MSKKYKYLKSEIYETFEVLSPPYDFKILRSFDVWRYDPEEFFANKSWIEVVQLDLYNLKETLIDLADVCSCMTTPALFNFLPAFMIISIDQFFTTDRKFPWNEASYIESSLTNEYRPDFDDFVESISNNKKKVIAKYLFESFLVNHVSRVSLTKTNAELAIDKYWYQYLSKNNLDVFLKLISNNVREKKVDLNKEKINQIKNQIELEFLDRANNENISLLINVVCILVDNNLKISDQVLLNLAENQALPLWVRNTISTTISCYGITRNSGV